MVWWFQIIIFNLFQVDNIVHRLNQRKTLYSLLYQAFEPSLLNGDNITFHSISFLIEMEGLYYIVLIEIPINFPNDPPKLAISPVSILPCDGQK